MFCTFFICIVKRFLKTVGAKSLVGSFVLSFLEGEDNLLDRFATWLVENPAKSDSF